MPIVSKRKIVWFYMVVIVITLLVAEVALHIIKSRIAPDRRYLLPAYQGKEWALELFKELQEDTRQRFVPYLGFGHYPYRGQYFNIDENGVRANWNPAIFSVAVPKTIYMFGGSTTMGYGARDEFTIPSYISKNLNSEESQYLVTNYGEGGYVFTQELLRLILLLRDGKRPDYVIFYDGVNDVAAAHEGGYGGAIGNVEFLKNQFESSGWGKVAGSINEHCFICSISLQLWRRVTHAHPATLVAESYSKEQLLKLAEDTAKYYLDSHALLDALSREFKFKYLTFWQPVTFTEPSLIGWEKTLYNIDPRVNDEDLALVYRRVNDILKNTTTTNFWNISGVFAERKEPLYIDENHITEEGNKIVAEAIVKIFRNKFEK